MPARDPATPLQVVWLEIPLDNYIRYGYSVVMKPIRHLLILLGSTILIGFCMVYPFLPGGFDRLAEGLSTIAQMLGVIGLLLVPVGALWLVHEWRRRVRMKQGLPGKDKRYAFALTSLIVGSLVALVLSLFAASSTGLSFGVLTLALWVYIVIGLIPRLKQLKNAVAETIHPAPFYLILLPVAALILQLVLAAPMTEFSRNRAIMNSAALINELENYYAAQGRYPDSLLALNVDFPPSVVGIAQYHFAPNGDAYNLFFQQPRFLLPELGAREIVMYNKLDEHIMLSHDSWILMSRPEELATRQGWYAVHDTAIPHWKYFWFD